MADFKNEFSWSFSRMGEFETCKRKYYYSRYRSWGGWRQGSGDHFSKELYFLKKLVHKETLIGLLVHDSIREALICIKQKKSWDLLQAMDRFESRFKETIKRSNSNPFSYTRGSIRMYEHEYGESIGEKIMDASIDYGKRCIVNFSKTSAFKTLINLPSSAFLSIDDSLEQFDLNGTIVYAKPDLVVLDEGILHIYDWKTGRRSDTDHSIQLSGYLLYALKKWNVLPSQVRLWEIRLGTQEEQCTLADQRLADSTIAVISKSIQSMKSLLDDPAVNEISEKNFPLAENRENCTSCVFQRVCFPKNHEKMRTLLDYV